MCREISVAGTFKSYFHTKPQLEYLIFLKNTFVSIKPIFLILLEIRNRPFATTILCCHVVFARLILNHAQLMRFTLKPYRLTTP